MTRIAILGLGPLGRRIAGDVVIAKRGQLVAAIDSAPAIAGTSLADLVPGAGPLTVAASIDAVDWSVVDCVIVATVSKLPLAEPTFRALLDRGVTVVSTCEELAYPWLRHRPRAEALDRLARERGGRLLGTGVNPGFLMDLVPLLATALCTRVRAVRVERIQDSSVRRLPFQHKIGTGMDPAELLRAVRAETMGHVGLGESLHFLADALGVTLEHWDEEVTPLVADRELSSGLGPVAAGRARGVRQVGCGYVGGAAVIQLVFQAGLGEEPVDRVTIDGDPPVQLAFTGGVHGDGATSAVVINSIAPLRAAAPGLHTMATIAPPRSRMV